MPIQDILLKASDDLHIGRVPAVKVLPDRRIKGLEVVPLNKVLL